MPRLLTVALLLSIGSSAVVRAEPVL